MKLETKLAFEDKVYRQEPESSYLLEILLSVDRRSEFYERTASEFKEARDDHKPFTEALIAKGYEVLIAYSDSGIVGHIAYQKHPEQNGESWHAFHLYLKPNNRGNGYFIPLCGELLRKAKEKGAVKIRFGKDTGRVNSVIIKKLMKMQDELGVVLSEGDSEITILSSQSQL